MSVQTAPLERREPALADARERSFAAGARLLSIGIASTGLFTFAYLAVASHVLDRAAYSRISLCWSIMFVILSVIYRPIEQLLSRTIAERGARGLQETGALRTPAWIQTAFAAMFLVVALMLRSELQNRVFDRSPALYWILVTGVLAYAVSYFARGWLAGSRRFALYGALVFLESTSRFLFALAAAVGITGGQDAVGAGMAAAPLVSLCVIPFALRHVGGRSQRSGASRATGNEATTHGASPNRARAAPADAAGDLSLRRGGGFAAAVVAIMLSEQTLINAGVIAAAASSRFDLTTGITGFVFNVMLIARAPLQLFQAVQTSILPHLTSMEARASTDEFRRTVRLTARIAFGFGAAVALGLLAVGPPVMHALVGDHGFTYGRLGLAVVGLGMGLHLTAGTFNQALLAREHAGRAAVAWLCAGALFVLFVTLAPIASPVTRTEVGYGAATAMLALSLAALYADSDGRLRSPARSRPAWIQELDLRSPGAVYLHLAGLALILAAASLGFHSTASYDPWSWLVWGRQLLHGGLDTAGGPTWKPLPVLFTTVFATFGNAQLWLWLVVARWGSVLSVLMTFKLAARITWSMRINESGTEAGSRVWRLAPAVLAGLVAATGLGLSGGYASDGWLGYSEGLAVAAMLIALERAHDGHHRQAFAIGTVVAWDRPESWVVWGPYGLWLMWRDPRARALVLGLALLTLFAWFVPQRLGGGSFTSGVSRAHNPRSNSAAFAAFPFWAELRFHAWDSVFIRAKSWAALGGLSALAISLRGWRDPRGWLRMPRHRAIFITGLLGLAGIGWWVLISLETQAGFSGNDRYLVLGSALVFICTGASVGWAAVALGRVLSNTDRRIRAGAHRIRPATATLAATVTVAIVYAFLPSGWVGRDVVNLRALRHALGFQNYLRRDVAFVIDRAGGHRAVDACGPVMTENFQVPMVAWYLHQVPWNVEAEPTVNAQGLDPVPAGGWPATIIQARATATGSLGPPASVVAGWEQEGASYRVIRTATVTLYQDCRG